MNFFAEQDKARRKTGLLVILMILAVISLIAITTLALSAFFYFAQSTGNSIELANTLQTPTNKQFWAIAGSDIALWAAFFIVAVVTGGSLFKMMSLGGSGAKVAHALGGRLLAPNTTEANERKVLNVVEEMAIASGNPVPQVYIIEESAINAFAAGTNRRNAVIGVTRGCIALLTREELQGVIAHEFSHIHNGDMRLNIRLVAVLHGILLIGLLGGYLLRSTAFTGHRNKNRGAQMGAGLVLWILGYCGVFFGSLIKAAVSRQREFLADASAVQFTRNPDGISGALKKIGGYSEHALLQNPNANEYSHFYFGQGVRTALGGLTATHPPLDIRIRRIDKRWNGQFVTPAAPHTASTQFAHGAASGFAAGAAAQASEAKPTSPPKNEMSSAEIDPLDIIGNPTHEHLAQASQLLTTMDNDLRAASHEPFSARALMYGLLLDKDRASVRTAQMAAIQANAHPQTVKTLNTLFPKLLDLPTAQVLPLVECAIPALKLQSKPQYQRFKSVMTALIKADNAVSMLEWCLYRIITACCETLEESAKYALTEVTEDLEVVIGALMYAGAATTPQHIEAVKAEVRRQLPNIPCQLRDKPAEVTFQALDKALQRLSQLKPLQKPAALKAFAACIYADQKATEQEQLLFKAITDVMNCPLPLQPPTH